MESKWRGPSVICNNTLKSLPDYDLIVGDTDLELHEIAFTITGGMVER